MTNAKILLLASALLVLPFHAAHAADAAPKAVDKAKVPAPVRPNRWLVQNDTNRDGKLSKQEFMTVHERYFKETDTNQDGFLTSEEIKAASDKRRAEREAAREARKKRQ